MNPLADAGVRELIVSIIQRFKTSREKDISAKVSDFALPATDPMYVPVLIELIRFDRSWHRDHGRNMPLDDYRREFPALRDDPAAQTLLAEDEPVAPAHQASNGSAASWSDSLGDGSIWHPSASKLAREPAGPFRISGQSSATGASLLADGGIAESDMVEAAEIYRRFRESPPSADDVQILVSQFESADVRAPTIDLFCDVHRSNPEFAARLARATVNMPVAGHEFLGFHLIDEIGRGAFGRVFLARQKDLADRNVVLKVTAELPGESQTLARLQHTNIVPVYSVHEHDPLIALCMPFFGTTTLADVVASLGPKGPLPATGKHLISTLNGRKKVELERSSLTDTSRRTVSANSLGAPTERTTVGVISQIHTALRSEQHSALQSLEGLSYVNAVLWIASRLADGLDHAHQCGILHRDLKPANVLLTDDGQPMLLDFNLSEDTRHRASAAAARAGGTLPYMSPEQMESLKDGRALDERSDLYSLGLILFELLSGKHAFPRHDGPAMKMVESYLHDRNNIQPRLRLHNKQVSPAAEAIVLHCLEINPERRYRSARELREDIDRHLADLPLMHAPEPSLRERVNKWRRRHPRLTSSTSVAIVCVAILALIAAFFTVELRNERRLEALDTLAGFREQVQSAKFVLNKAEPNQRQLAEGIGLCTEALGRYRALDGVSLDVVPAARNLPSPAERTALQNEIREALLILARAQVLQSGLETEPHRQRQVRESSLHLLDLARSNYGDGMPWKTELLESADLNRLLGNVEESDRQLKAAAELNPRSADECCMLALKLSDRRELSLALPLLDEATRRDPHNIWAWFYRGFCQREMQEYPEAIRCFTASIALAPRHETAYLPYFNRAISYARVGRFAEAIADMDEAIQLRPDSVDARFNRAIIYLDWDKFPEAIADLDDAQRRDPTFSRVFFVRARARAKMGDSEGARRDRADGLRAQPVDELGWIDRALARVESDPIAALGDLDQALKLNPRSLLALQNKAFILGERLGRQEDAVHVLNKEVALYPGFVRGRIGRGVHLARLGRREEAIADAREALSRSALGETFYQAANIFSLTSQQQAEDASEAYPLLASALEKGFGLDLVDKDTDFDPIRGQAEFRRVVNAARELNTAARKAGR